MSSALTATASGPDTAAIPDASRTHVRYWVLAMVFIVTTFNYADRATLSITGPTMGREFGFDTIQMGYIFSAFSWAYVLAQVPGGWLLDRFGARKVYAASIFFWSAFTLLQATVGVLTTAATAMVALFAMRFCVGIAEAPAFPANAKVVASWFPTQERGTASAIFNAAQYFAAVVFTPLMAAMTHWFGWHWVYLSMGAVGMLLAVAWWGTVRSPARHPAVNRAELAHIAAGGGLIHEGEQPVRAAGAATRGRTASHIRQLLTHRMLVGIYLGQFSINVLTYFFLTWFPVYLVQERHMSILKAGFMVSLPAICGFAGGVLGGLFSDWLLRRGVSLTVARKTPIVIGMLMSVSMILCNYVNADWMIVAIMALAFFGKGFGAFGWAVMADVAPKEVMGLAGSIFNTFGAIAGIVTPIVIGYILAATHSFGGALVFVGLNALVTVFAYLFIVQDIERIELKP
ncbi:MFS transporter [Acidovorax sp. NCPPB 4044]|uniref:MFS transporter n=1 Tax=Acidovorax sp. NCPPB 4044 TaxID=2940490 RepID=UPI002302134E|nr:MFS transporter [Acidovorax sp. NCPPB 4044]MDA8520706.1 MFS transporter [Acidovorax sp. NCPPB 4044]